MSTGAPDPRDEALRAWALETLGSLEALTEHFLRVSRRASEHLESVLDREQGDGA